MILSLFVILCMTGCGSNDGLCYSEYEHIEEEGWDPMRILGFSPSPVDTLASDEDKYMVVVTLRYTDECQAADVPVMVNEQDEDGEIASEVRKIRLRNDSGKTLGRKGLVFYELSDTLRSGFKLPKNYWVELASLAPAEYTRGISEVGMELIRDRR